VALGSALSVLISDSSRGNDNQPSEFTAIPAKTQFSAPSLMLSDLSGVPHALSDYRGRVVLVNLWATWCPPCAAEMPNLQIYFEKHREQGFVVVAVEDGDPRTQVLSFVQSQRLTFPVWLDPSYQATDRAFRTNSLPSSYVIDREQIVRLVWVGAINAANLEKYVTPLIQE
jgi:peroxiredoxin